MISIRTLRIIRWSTLALIVLLASGIAVIQFGPKGSSQRQASTTDVAAGTVAIPEGVPIGGTFTLIDDKGHAVTDADYRGRWVLVFFGYTNCPDECPLRPLPVVDVPPYHYAAIFERPPRSRLD
jgi:protein SCO1/2